MKRYDLVQVNACYTTDHEMEPADDGEWVRFDEVVGIIAGYEQRMRLIQWWSSLSSEQPPSTNAVDPSATDPGTPTPRDPASSSSSDRRGRAITSQEPT